MRSKGDFFGTVDAGPCKEPFYSHVNGKYERKTYGPYATRDEYKPKTGEGNTEILALPHIELDVVNRVADRAVEGESGKCLSMAPCIGATFSWAASRRLPCGYFELGVGAVIAWKRWNIAVHDGGGRETVSGGCIYRNLFPNMLKDSGSGMAPMRI